MHEVKSIGHLLDQISHGSILLPEFQRGYVWNRNQVRGLMHSLYRKHPTGHLLIWQTYKPSLVRGAEAARNGHSLMLARRAAASDHALRAVQWSGAAVLRGGVVVLRPVLQRAN